MIQSTPASKPVLSFSDVRDLIGRLPAADEASQAAASSREARLTKPAGSLGRLEQISAWLCAWQGRHPPAIDHAQIVVFAGNHGVTGQGVSAFPAEVTAQMVANFAAGGAAINQLAEASDAQLSVIDLELDRPTADMTAAPAMTEEECTSAITTGFRSVGDETDILLVGEMGIGNTTAGAALGAALFGGAGAEWAGPGTGLDAEGISVKARVIDAAIARHGAALDDPLEALRRIGGREVAALVGAVLAARMIRCPVILDGFVTAAAAAVLYRLDAGALDHCLTGHLSAEPAHRRLLDRLNQDPLLDLGMRLGEGSGAALALALVRAAVACHNGMATFSEAGVSEGG